MCCQLQRVRLFVKRVDEDVILVVQRIQQSLLHFVPGCVLQVQMVVNESLCSAFLLLESPFSSRLIVFIWLLSSDSHRASPNNLSLRNSHRDYSEHKAEAIGCLRRHVSKRHSRIATARRCTSGNKIAKRPAFDTDTRSEPQTISQALFRQRVYHTIIPLQANTKHTAQVDVHVLATV